MKKTAFLAALFTLMLTGCGPANKLSDSPPEGEPWNFMNIMETDDGYYSNMDYYELWDETTAASSENIARFQTDRTEGGLSYLINSYHLWYMDKKSGKTVMVCDKPECPHDGRDSCTATFRSLLSGPVRLYDNSVYFIAPDIKKDKVTVSLYRTAPDGSSIDICSEFMSTKTDTLGTDYWIDCSDLIIHKGYAYSNFVLSTDTGGYPGFHGGGFYCTDLRTGKTTAIEEYDDYWESRIAEYVPCGDYIFLAEMDNLDNVEYTRLNIYTGEQRPVPLDKAEKVELMTADENRVYFKPCAGPRNSEIISLDPESFEEKSENISIKRDGLLFAYDGKLFAYYIMDREKSITVYENGKEILNTTDIPMNESSDTHQIFISFTHDKIYATVDTWFGQQIWSCPVRDFASGNINWTCVIDSKTVDPPCQDYVKSFK